MAWVRVEAAMAKASSPVLVYFGDHLGNACIKRQGFRDFMLNLELLSRQEGRFPPPTPSFHGLSTQFPVYPFFPSVPLDKPQHHRYLVREYLIHANWKQHKPKQNPEGWRALDMICQTPISASTCVVRA